MWSIIQKSLPFIIFIIIVTQVIIPLIFDRKIFWSFRKKSNKIINDRKDSTILRLKDELDETKEIVANAKETVENVKTKVDKNLKSAEDLKKDADNLL